MYASRFGHADTARVLIKHGARLEAVNTVRIKKDKKENNSLRPK